MFSLKNKDRFEHEIVLKILSKSEPSCSYKIVLIKKKSVFHIKLYCYQVKQDLSRKCSAWKVFGPSPLPKAEG